MKYCLMMVMAVVASVCHGRVVYVSSANDGDSVYIEGVFVGLSPCMLEMPEGRYNINVRNGLENSLERMLYVEESDKMIGAHFNTYPKPNFSSDATEEQKRIINQILSNILYYPANCPGRVDGLSSCVVSMEEWETITGKSHKYSSRKGLKDHKGEVPYIGMSLDEANAFIAELNRLSGLDFALPTTEILKAQKIERKSFDYFDLEYREYYLKVKSIYFTDRKLYGPFGIGSYLGSSLGNEFSRDGSVLWPSWGYDKVPSYVEDWQDYTCLRLYIAPQIQNYDNVPTYDIDALLAHRKQEEAEKRTIFEQALKEAENGDAKNMYTVANYYYAGYGCERNVEKAMEWTRKAISLNYEPSWLNMAFLLKNHEDIDGNLNDPEYVAMIYKSLAERGNADAKAMLAECYLDGRGVVKSSETFVQLARESAQEGSVEGMAYAAYSYIYSLEPDLESAKRWIDQAIMQKSSKTTVDAYWTLLRECSKDERYGDLLGPMNDLLRIGYLCGSQSASLNYAGTLLQGKGIPQDLLSSMAVYYDCYANPKFDKATHSKAAYYIGEIYNNGWGVAPDAKLAKKWLEISADGENINAMESLAKIYKREGNDDDAEYFKSYAEDLRQAANLKGDPKPLMTPEKQFELDSVKYFTGKWQFLSQIPGGFKAIQAKYGRFSLEECLYRLMDMIKSRNAVYVEYTNEYDKIIDKVLNSEYSDIEARIDAYFIAGGASFVMATQWKEYCASIYRDYHKDWRVQYLTEKANQCYARILPIYDEINYVTPNYIMALADMVVTEQADPTRRASLGRLLILHIKKYFLREFPKLNEKEREAMYEKYAFVWTELLPMVVYKEDVVDDKMSRLIYDSALLYKGLLLNFDIKSLSNFEADWQMVKSNLKDKEAAVEIINTVTGYKAAVLRKDSKAPVVVDIITEEYLKTIEDFYGTTLVYQMFWKKIEPYLTDCKKVYVSPDGMFHEIAFESVPISGLKYIDEVYDIARVSSTREIGNLDARFQPRSALLVGGVDYGEVKSRQRGGFGYLPETESEVMAIDKMLRQANTRTSVTTGSAAEEKSVSSEMQKADMLHFATHGYFFNPKQFNSLPYKELREEGDLAASGLLLANANKALRGETQELFANDGLLTGADITHLDLKGAQLVVLSACETAKGRISSEGVYGLQRGFKAAGAKSIVMSLWKVDDKVTSMFMTKFYSSLLSGDSKHEALNSARRYIRNYESDEHAAINGYKFHPYKSPRCWAAFILLD